MISFRDLLQQGEEAIRAGQGVQVSKLMAELPVSKIPRELCLPFANVCRRAGLIHLGMRILAPVIHHEKNRWQIDASSQELAEYAVLLQKCGATREALQTLQRVDMSVVPEALLYQSFCFFNMWDYAAAVPLLKRYLTAHLSDYSMLVGHVNLAAALLETNERAQAKPILDWAIASASQYKLGRLQANSLELRAQLRIREGQFAEARNDLREAAGLLSADPTTDQLFVEKWTAILHGLETGANDPIRQFRGIAERRGHWESVREADFYSLRVAFEKRRFNFLLFGTPHAGYRSKIYDELKRRADQHVYVYGTEGGRRLNLTTGELDGHEGVNPGKTVHRVLDILTRDFYRPMRMGALFAELFPGEYFDINSSPGRVHQVLRRARHWLGENHIPVSIQSEEGNCRLTIQGDFGFIVELEPSAKNSTLEIQLQSLRTHFGGTDFTAREAREMLGIPLTSFHRLLQFGIEAGKIQRIGNGPATRYEFVGIYPKFSLAA